MIIKKILFPLLILLTFNTNNITAKINHNKNNNYNNNIGNQYNELLIAINALDLSKVEKIFRANIKITASQRDELLLNINKIIDIKSINSMTLGRKGIIRALIGTFVLYKIAVPKSIKSIKSFTTDIERCFIEVYFYDEHTNTEYSQRRFSPEASLALLKELTPTFLISVISSYFSISQIRKAWNNYDDKSDLRKAYTIRNMLNNLIRI